MIDINRAIKHPFEDKDWLQKGVIGALISAVPILNFAILGWLIEHVKNVANNADAPLPDWTQNLGDKFAAGIKLVVVYLVYTIPIWALYCVMMFVLGGMSALADGSSRQSASDAAAAGFGIVSMAVGCVMFVYGLVLAYLYPAILIQFIRKGQHIAPALRLGEILAITKANGSDYLMTFLAPLAVNFGLGIVLSVVGTIAAFTIVGLCVFVPASLLIAPYLLAITAHFTGQYARQHAPLA